MEILLPAMHSWLVCSYIHHHMNMMTMMMMIMMMMTMMIMIMMMMMSMSVPDDSYLSQQSDIPCFLHWADSQLLPEEIST